MRHIKTVLTSPLNITCSGISRWACSGTSKNRQVGTIPDLNKIGRTSFRNVLSVAAFKLSTSSTTRLARTSWNLDFVREWMIVSRYFSEFWLTLNHKSSVQSRTFSKLICKANAHTTHRNNSPFRVLRQTRALRTVVKKSVERATLQGRGPSLFWKKSSPFACERWKNWMKFVENKD